MRRIKSIRPGSWGMLLMLLGFVVLFFASWPFSYWLIWWGLFLMRSPGMPKVVTEYLISSAFLGAITFGVIDRSYSQATLICWGGIACLCWLVMGYTAQIECSSQPRVRPP
jgi:hypothetical protein